MRMPRTNRGVKPLLQFERVCIKRGASPIGAIRRRGVHALQLPRHPVGFLEPLLRAVELAHALGFLEEIFAEATFARAPEFQA